MKDFVAIDFETANPKRVSACALGFAKVSNGKIVESREYLIKPVGGHASFQSKIHGLKDEHTHDKPEFGELVDEIQEIFDCHLIGHSLFDKQVLNALSIHFDLRLEFRYTDSSALAKKKLPDLKNHRLKTLAKHFNLPAFKHHSAEEDAVVCAKVYLNLQGQAEEEVIVIKDNDAFEFRGMIRGILADNEVNYKEAYELLYWLEDHSEIAELHQNLYEYTKEALNDDHLDSIEATEIQTLLKQALDKLI